MSPVETMYGMLGTVVIEGVYWAIMGLCVFGIWRVLRWGFRSS